MLKYILLGVLLVAITVVIHALGTTSWLRHLGRLYGDATKTDRPAPSLRILINTIIVLTILHTIQVIVWALAFLYLLPENVIHTFEEASYFSFVTFTTLGYGDISFTGVWRILSGIEALNGVLLIGWSTALLFVVVQRIMKDMLQRGADKITN